MPVNNFTVIESDYGRFIVNRHCDFQAEALIKTGRPHIQAELNNILAIASQLPAGCVIVDAGANIGLVAVPLAQSVRGRGGVVHAFEAQRMICYALCGAAALNDLENLVVHNAALGAAPGSLGIGRPDYGRKQDFGTFSLVAPPETATERIDVVAIDSVGLDRLDFLKIDVEGMEPQVLSGARGMIEAHLPWCWVEYWKVGIEDIKRHFAGLDYNFYVMDNLNLLCVPEKRLAGSSVRIQAPPA